MLFQRGIAGFIVKFLLFLQLTQALPQPHQDAQLLAPRGAQPYPPRQCFTQNGTKKPTKAVVPKTTTATVTKSVTRTKYVKPTSTVTAPAKTITKRYWTLSKTTTTLSKKTDTFSTTTTIVEPSTKTETVIEIKTETARTTVIGVAPANPQPLVERRAAPTEDKPLAEIDGSWESGSPEAEVVAHLEGRSYKKPATKPAKKPKTYVTAVNCIVKTTKTVRPTVVKTAAPCTKTVYPRPVVSTTTKTIGITFTSLPTPAKTTTVFTEKTTVIVATTFSTKTETTVSTSTIYEPATVTGSIRVKNAEGADLGYVKKALINNAQAVYGPTGDPLQISFPVTNLGGLNEDVRVSAETTTGFELLVLAQGRDNTNTDIGPGSYQ